MGLDDAKAAGEAGAASDSQGTTSRRSTGEPVGSPDASAVIARSTGKGRGTSGETQAWRRRTFNVVVAGLLIATACFVACSIYEVVTLRGQLVDIHADAWQTMSQELQGAKPEFRARALLETMTLRERYHEASGLLLSRAWTLQLAFVVGTILALVGATFVLGRFRDEGSKLDVEGGGGKIEFAASSPGLVLAVLGVLVMLASMAMNRPIDIRDVPLYVTEVDSDAVSPPPSPFPSGSGTPTQDIQKRVDQMKTVLAAGHETPAASASAEEPRK